jgi:small subunit ribosomal protein S14
MTTSDYTKAMKQIQHKGVKLARYMKNCTPKKRTYGAVTRKCRRCGQSNAHIRKYGLHYCRHCFRDIATKIGFRQYS